MAARSPANPRFEAEVREYEKMESEREKLELAFRRLTTQLHENKMVQTELSKLEDGCEVYKMIGPVMMRQDAEEAVSTVGKRIEFIASELKRSEQQIKDINSKMAEKRKKIGEMQMAMQQQAQQAALAARQQQALLQQAQAQAHAQSQQAQKQANEAKPK